jgi:hypothetical protein
MYNDCVITLQSCLWCLKLSRKLALCPLKPIVAHIPIHKIGIDFAKIDRNSKNYRYLIIGIIVLLGRLKLKHYQIYHKLL